MARHITNFSIRGRLLAIVALVRGALVCDRIGIDAEWKASRRKEPPNGAQIRKDV